MNNIIYCYDSKNKVYGVAQYDETDVHTEFPVPEASILNSLRSGVRFQNIALKDNKIIATSGALTRFSPKTMVVLSRLCTNTDKLIGYRVLASNGQSFRWKLNSIQAFCKNAKANGFVPFQNAIYVEANADTDAHIKSYPDSPFPTQIISIQAKKPVVKDNKAEKPTNLKEILQKQDSLFTEAQKLQLRLGVEAGLNVLPYAHPEIPAENMHAIRDAMTRGQDVTFVTNNLDYVSDVSVLALKYVLVVLAEGIDVSAMLNPDFNVAQLGEIHVGLVSGLDVTAYAYPQLSAYQMSLERCAQEGDYWQDFEG